MIVSPIAYSEALRKIQYQTRKSLPNATVGIPPLTCASFLMEGSIPISTIYGTNTLCDPWTLRSCIRCAASIASQGWCTTGAI